MCKRDSNYLMLKAFVISSTLLFIWYKPLQKWDVLSSFWFNIHNLFIMKRFLTFIFLVFVVIFIWRIDTMHSIVCKYVYGTQFNKHRINQPIAALPDHWKGKFIDDAYVSYRSTSKKSKNSYYGKDIQFVYFFRIFKEIDYYRGAAGGKTAFLKKIYFYESGNKYYRLFTSVEVSPVIIFDGGRFIPSNEAENLINSWTSTK